MTVLLRTLGLVLLLALALAPADPAGAATPKQIDIAIQRGIGFLKERYKGGVTAGEGTGGGQDTGGIGTAALVGLALLEAGVPPNDPALRRITAAVREASYGQKQTYQVSLCILYLDRLGEPADVPLIQAMAVRLLVGQGPDGGWTYGTVGDIPAAEQQRLRAALQTATLQTAPPANPPGQPARKLHPAVEQHAAVLSAGVGRAAQGGGDNSNTQFGLLALWVARRHGVPAEAALDRCEQRFLASQQPNGGWPYSGLSGTGSPSMTCVGLIGLAVGLGRREERRITTNTPPKPEPKAAAEKANPKSDDPFFNPPARKEPDKKGERPGARLPPNDPREIAIQRGMANLGAVLVASLQQGGLVVGNPGGGHGERDLYFMWCLERVGVIFGLEKIGGVDWYDAGSTSLVALQQGNGSWMGGHYSPEVNTSFALLFLSKSNVVRDLSSKVQGDKDELKGGSGKDPLAGRNPAPAAPAGPPPLPDDEAGKAARALVGAPRGEWQKTLEILRDTQGPRYTRALALSIPHLEADRRKEAREALAERLTRMSADTLRAMLKSGDAEVRRAAALACAMKEEWAHIPDLIDRLTDDEEFVARAAKAGLKSLTGQDLGPANGAPKDQRKAAAAAWRAWWAKQQKK